MAIYKINGGGDLIELSTSDSDIEIYKLVIKYQVYSWPSAGTASSAAVFFIAIG